MRNKVEITGINTSELKTIPSSLVMDLIKKSQSGDKEARDYLVEGNIKLVLSVIKKFNNMVEMIPSNLVAKLLNYKTKNMFTIKTYERNNIKVNFNE